jgi:hypothetical protein
VGGKELLLTSAEMVDVLSRNDVKVRAVERVAMTQDKDRSVLALAQDKATLTVNDATDQKQTEFTLKNDGAATLTAQKTFSLLAGATGSEWKLDIDGEAGKVFLGKDPWKLSIEQGDIALRGDKAGLQIMGEAVGIAHEDGTEVVVTPGQVAVRGKGVTLTAETNNMVVQGPKVLLG